MKIIRATYLALAALLSAVSCSKETAEPDVYDWTNGDIYFKPSISDVVSSRAQDMTLDRLKSFQVTCFNAGYDSPYFENATFERKANGSYESSSANGPTWPSDNVEMRFFAFSPSLSVMANNPILSDFNKDQYFNLINRTSFSQLDYTVDYRLGKFRIDPDISRQFDFITGTARGTRLKDFMAGVDIAFRHHLCQVELRAWGASEEYDFEIAGVRIGNPVVEGEFVFTDKNDPNAEGSWNITDSPVKDKVEYLFQPNDKLYRIYADNNGTSLHETPESAESIMGSGGNAMVLPTKNLPWEGLDDPNISNSGYTTDKMYFSILLRVTDKTGDLIYPYPENPYEMTVVYYAVDKNGEIVARLQPGGGNDDFYTDDGLPYVKKEDEEIKEFGWAAVPVGADWKAGKKHIYTLDYSEGIGLHDPEENDPGKPIGGLKPIEWNVTVSGWEHAEKDENYNPDLDVP